MFGGRFQRGDDDIFDLVHGDCRRPTRPWIFDQTVQTGLDEAGPPLAHCGHRDLFLGSNFGVAQALGAG